MPGFEHLTASLIVWIAVVVLFSGFVHGALGLGFPTIATPLIALVTDIRTAVILVLLPCLVTIIVSIAKGGALTRVLTAFWTMPIYMLVGAAIGTRLFIAYPQFPYALLLSAVILIYLNLDRLGRTEWPSVQRRKNTFGFVFGVLAGISEGTANVAAPPLIIYYLALGVQPVMLVPALNICFLAGKTTQFVTLAFAGGVTTTQWLITLPFCGAAAASVLLGLRIRNRIDAATYQRWIKRALFAMAAILCGQYLYERLWMP